VHVDLLNAQSFTTIAATSADIRTEVKGCECPFAGPNTICQRLSEDLRETSSSEYCRPARAFAPAGRLIEDLTDPAIAGNAVTQVGGWGFVSLEDTPQCLAQDLEDESRFTGARHTGHAGELTQRKTHIDIG